jgi:hypothetical protein
MKLELCAAAAKLQEDERASLAARLLHGLEKLAIAFQMMKCCIGSVRR